MFWHFLTSCKLQLFFSLLEYNYLTTTFLVHFLSINHSYILRTFHVLIATKYTLNIRKYYLINLIIFHIKRKGNFHFCNVLYFIQP